MSGFLVRYRPSLAFFAHLRLRQAQLGCDRSKPREHCCMDYAAVSVGGR
jgi:hypothetical protein